MTKKKSQKSRFFERVINRVVINRRTNCWEYQGRKSEKKYGIITDKNTKKTHRVHRVIYTHFFGEIPSNFDVHHNCKNKGCCNPNHLEIMEHKAHAIYEQIQREIPIKISWKIYHSPLPPPPSYLEKKNKMLTVYNGIQNLSTFTNNIKSLLLGTVTKNSFPIFQKVGTVNYSTGTVL